MSNPSEDFSPAGAAGDSLLPPAGEPGFDTLLVRAGAGPDPVNGAVLTPVHQNTTYLQDGIGRDPRNAARNPSITPTIGLAA